MAIRSRSSRGQLTDNGDMAVKLILAIKIVAPINEHGIVDELSTQKGRCTQDSHRDNKIKLSELVF